MGAIAVKRRRRVELHGVVDFASYIAFEWIPMWAWFTLFAAWMVAITVAVVALVVS